MAEKNDIIAKAIFVNSDDKQVAEEELDECGVISFSFLMSLEACISNGLVRPEVAKAIVITACNHERMMKKGDVPVLPIEGFRSFLEMTDKEQAICQTGEGLEESVEWVPPPEPAEQKVTINGEELSSFQRRYGLEELN